MATVAGQRSTGRTDASSVATPSKLAEQIARHIEHEVMAAGWPVGDVIGSEGLLLDRYQVSRAVLREAVRIVEYLGVARMRPGPGGGLVVTEPDPSAVSTAVTVYLTYRRVRLGEVLAARRPMEEMAVRVAARQHDPVHLADLAARIALEEPGDRDDHWVLHELMARAGGNPALELFVDILGRVTERYLVSLRSSPAERNARRLESVAAHQAIVAAVAAGDEDAAARRMVRHLDAIGEFLSSRQRQRTLGFADALISDGDGKLAEVVAGRIFAEVVSLGWPVGELLGSEAELLVRHDVSRAVLREALRLLEFHRVVRTRRGPGGGVLIDAPDEMATTETMAVYLESRRITAAQLFEVRAAMEIATVDLAAQHMDAAGVEALRAALDEEHAAPPEQVGAAAHVLHLRIAELTGNSAVQLFLHALTRLTEQHSVHPDQGLAMSYEEAAAEVHHAHASIVNAIAAGDRDLARRRMQRHLDAVVPLLR